MDEKHKQGQKKQPQRKNSQETLGNCCYNPEPRLLWQSWLPAQGGLELPNQSSSGATCLGVTSSTDCSSWTLYPVSHGRMGLFRFWVSLGSAPGHFSSRIRKKQHLLICLDDQEPPQTASPLSSYCLFKGRIRKEIYQEAKTGGWDEINPLFKAKHQRPKLKSRLVWKQ